MSKHDRRLAARRAIATQHLVESLTHTEQRDLLAAASLVRDTWLEWGPTDDGTASGEAFNEALGELHYVVNYLLGVSRTRKGMR